MKLSERVAKMEFSPIRKFTTKALQVQEEGKKIYFVNIGQPDLETPDGFIDAVKNFDDKTVEYQQSRGDSELLDAVIGYFRHYGIELTQENILITNGGSEALTLVFTSILDPGDEIMMAEPFYTNYATFCESACGNIAPVHTKAEDGYAWADRELLEKSITPKTKAICCTSPGNPTGCALTIDEMRVVGQFAKDHDLWIVADEVYREFVYDDGPAVSFGQLEEFADRLVIIDSVSKRYSACGARVGAAISKNKDLMDGLLKLAQARLCSPTLEQRGAAALYRLEPSYYDEAVKEYKSRRDAAYEEISKIPGVICRRPSGSFYLMAKLPVDDIEDFLMFMLEEFEDKGETVLFTPAEGFYKTPGLGRDEIRLAYVLEADKMRRAAELIRLGLEAYKAR